MAASNRSLSDYCLPMMSKPSLLYLCSMYCARLRKHSRSLLREHLPRAFRERLEHRAELYSMVLSTVSKQLLDFSRL